MTKREIIKYLEKQADAHRNDLVEKKNEAQKEFTQNWNNHHNLDTLAERVWSHIVAIDKLLADHSREYGVPHATQYDSIFYRVLGQISSHADCKRCVERSFYLPDSVQQKYEKLTESCYSVIKASDKEWQKLIAVCKSLPNAKAVIEYLVEIGFDTTELSAEPVKVMTQALSTTINLELLGVKQEGE